jgi:hypothetical protein
MTAGIVECSMSQDLIKSIAPNTRTALTVPPARLNWKWFRALMIVPLLMLGAGCSGIHASKRISPLDFFLPGLIQNETPTPSGPLFPVLAPGDLAAQS